MADVGLADALRQSVERRYDDYLADLEGLTSIDCPTGHKPGLDLVAGVVAGRLKEVGATVRILSNPVAGDDVKGTIQGSGNSRTLILCHTDTVYPVGTCAARPFRVEGGRALAPGVCDMKGGLLSAIYSLHALRDAGVASFGSITILCNSDEERAPRHSVEAIEDAARAADCVFTMEPARTNGDIVSARKGVAVYRVTAHGREAHAGVNPDRGRSAIVALSDRIVAMWGLNGKYAGLNVNPGILAGGSAVNTVAGEAWCEIDIRVLTVGDLERFDRDLRELLSTSLIPDVRFEAVCSHTMPPMERTSGSQRLVDLARRAAAELGFEVNDTATGGGSDGAYAAATGTPVLDGLGPIGGNAHSEREYLDLDSVIPRTAMLARMITLL